VDRPPVREEPVDRADPGYWRKAIATVTPRNVDTRAFFAPATSTAVYRWGTIKEGVAAGSPGRLQHVDPTRLPVGERYGSNLAAAVEQPYFGGLPADGEAQLFRYLGVRDVVLQNDLDWERSHTARPAAMQVLADAAGIETLSTFGVPGQNVVPRGEDDRDARSVEEESLAPVQVLTVADPAPVVRAEGPDPVVVSGDGFGMAEAARAGYLAGGPAVLYSGALTQDELAALLQRSTPSFVVTDTNRRVVWSFTTPTASHSYTLPAGQTLKGRTTGYDLFGDRNSTQTVAEYPGLASITASESGAALRSSPEFRPANAFDGNHHTVWQVGDNDDPRGSWIQATFQQDERLSSVEITLPEAGLGRRVRDVRLEFSDGSSLTRELEPGTITVINFDERTTASLRVRILSVTRGFDTRSPVAIADIRMGDLRPAEVIRVPNDVFQTARAIGALDKLQAAPITFLFERLRTSSPRDVDEEIRLARRFVLPIVRSFRYTGVAALDPTADDDEIDRLLLGDSKVHVESSSRFLGFPERRGSMAFDGDRKTEWVPSGNVGEQLSISFPPTTIDHFTVHLDLGKNRTPITGLTAEFSDGTTAKGTVTNLLDRDLTVEFPAVTTSNLTLTVDSVFEVNGAAGGRPIAITDVDIPGVDPLTFSPSAPLPCSTGIGFSIDREQRGIRLQGTQRSLLSEKDLEIRTMLRRAGPALGRLPPDPGREPAPRPVGGPDEPPTSPSNRSRRRRRPS
jgi:hypothetical protein